MFLNVITSSLLVIFPKLFREELLYIRRLMIIRLTVKKDFEWHLALLCYVVEVSLKPWKRQTAMYLTSQSW